MSKEIYARELRERIALLGTRIDADRAKLEFGTAPDKVDAAGEIADLQRRRAELESRLHELEQEPEGGSWQTMTTTIEGDMLDLEAAFNRWARKYY